MRKGNRDLVAYLFDNGTIKKKEVAAAMEKVDRQYYCPRQPYQDSPQPIGFGATISAPHMHAYALQYLFEKLAHAKNVLDIGSGTGYLTAAMAYLIPPTAKVYGIQHVPELVKMSIQNIHKGNPDLFQQGRVEVKQGDGRKGWPDKQITFDVIHVGAASPTLPEALLEQLAEGGRMVIPVGGQHSQQVFKEVNKKDGKIEVRDVLSVRYVPLTDLKHQLL